VGYTFTLDDVDYLRSAAGVAALAHAAELPLTPASLLRDLPALRTVAGERTGALVETVLLRRRATAKLTDAAHWLFTDDALQQATPTAVAAHRARRLAGRAVHDVTCSIGAELAALTRTCATVVGSDLDPVRLAMAAGNVPAAALLRADALRPVTRDTVVLADPARRADGRRTADPARLQPPLPDLLAAYRGRDLAVKCAPGLDFDRLDWPGEIELTSLDGGVREACLWSPGLGEPGVRRRASVLRSGGGRETVTDTEPDALPIREPGEWIVNPDGAVVRAGLVRQYAARHALWQLDPRIAYLTGDAVPPGVRGFRVLTRLDYKDKALRAELVRRDCGPLEILARGVDIDPDALRARLKLRGDRPHTVVLTRIGARPTAFICHAGRPDGPDGR
jgi:hypothetical protein